MRNFINKNDRALFFNDKLTSEQFRDLSEVQLKTLEHHDIMESSSAMYLTPGSPTPTPFNPKDIAEAIAEAKDPLLEHLPLESLLNLSLTTKTLYGEYQPYIASYRLASRVLWNRPDEVNKLLEAAKDNPEKLMPLLQNPVIIPIELPSGHLFQGYTPFQAALCTWNIELCELFKGYFKKIPDGLEKMQAQINKIFPEGIEAHIEKQKKAALEFKDKTLRPLIDVISANTTSEADVKAMLKEKHADSLLGKAIAAFREEIEKLSGEDHVSNPFYLQEASHLYEECLDTFTTWDQRDLFCIQGIGYVQCYSPACDLQAFAQGLYYLIVKRETFLGSFKFTDVWDGVTHLEIKMKDFRSLGFDYVADRWGGGGQGCRVVGVGGSTRISEFFIKQKQQALQIFCAGIAAACDQFRNGFMFLDRVKALKDANIKKLFENKRLTHEQFMNLDWDRVEALKHDNISKLFEINGLTYEQFINLNLEQVQALKDDNIGKLFENNRLTHEQFMNLNLEQVQALKDDNIGKLFENNALTYEQFINLNLEQVQALKDGNIGKLLLDGILTYEGFKELSLKDLQLLNNDNTRQHYVKYVLYYRQKYNLPTSTCNNADTTTPTSRPR